jgi:hypothetical protein
MTGFPVKIPLYVRNDIKETRIRFLSHAAGFGMTKKKQNDTRKNGMMQGERKNRTTLCPFD